MICLAVLAVACIDPQQAKRNEVTHNDVVRSRTYILRAHDDSLHVTCWLSSQGVASGISCLPDWQLVPR